MMTESHRVFISYQRTDAMSPARCALTWLPPVSRPGWTSTTFQLAPTGRTRSIRA